MPSMRSRTLWFVLSMIPACSPATTGDAGVPGVDAGMDANAEASIAVRDADGLDVAAIDAITDASPSDAPTCETPDQCTWIEDYQREIVGRLSGERAITPGVTLTSRSSVAQRTTTRVYLRDELIARGLSAGFHDYATGQNVVARLAATTGAMSARIVVGAHYDSVTAGPGAADDATGVAIVLVAARYLLALPHRDHPVDFVLFDQEEIGLVGSRAYAETLHTEGAAVDSMHAFDMLSFDGDSDQAVELWSPSTGLEALYRLHGTPRGIPIAAVAFTSSDHQSFLTRGFPAVGVGEEFVGGDHTPHYHRATDTFDRVDFAYLARVTRLALDVLADRVTD